MAEERILILNLLREGKISAAEAERLLHAVRDSATPPPAAAPPTPSMFGQAASLAGKALDFIPKPKVDTGKLGAQVSEKAGVAFRAAKSAAQDVAAEVGKITQQTRQALHFDGPPTFGPDTGRPTNRNAQAEASETSHSDIPWNGTGADKVLLVNAYGNIKVIGQEGTEGVAQTTLVKTAWAETDTAARVLLQQVFLVNRVEGGTCRVEVIAPADAAGRLTVDYEVVVPPGLLLELQTTFGTVEAQGTTPALVARSQSGRLAVRHPHAESAGEARLTTASGDILIDGWNAPSGSLLVETASGDVEAQDVHCGRSLVLSSRSGDLVINGGSAGTRASVQTQSGSTRLSRLRAEQLQVETVSGNVTLRESSGALSLKTVSGTVDASGLNTPAVSLNTISADAHLSFAAPFSGSVAGTTVSGDLTLALWDNSDTRVDMTTTSGELSCALPLADRSGDGTRHLAGTIGDGTGRLKLQSVSGDLKIEAQR